MRLKKPPKPKDHFVFCFLQYCLFKKEQSITCISFSPPLPPIFQKWLKCAFLIFQWQTEQDYRDLYIFRHIVRIGLWGKWWAVQMHCVICWIPEWCLASHLKHRLVLLVLLWQHLSSVRANCARNGSFGLALKFQCCSSMTRIRYQ